MLLYDTELSGASLAVDPDTQDDVFSDWLNKTAAALEQSAIIFFVIDNAELLHVIIVILTCKYYYYYNCRIILN